MIVVGILTAIRNTHTASWRTAGEIFWTALHSCNYKSVYGELTSQSPVHSEHCYAQFACCRHVRKPKLCDNMAVAVTTKWWANCCLEECRLSHDCPVTRAWPFLRTAHLNSHASHNDVSVNDGPHIRLWSHNIITLTTVLQLPTVFSTVHAVQVCSLAAIGYTI